MLRLRSYIGFVLLAVFSITFLPVNLLHHHEEQLHKMAVVTGNMHGHSCLLDTYFCQQAFSHSCSHASHVQNKVQKCFSCQFHFIKHFVTGTGNNFPPPDNSPVIKTEPGFASTCIVIVPYTNKGPPSMG